MIKYKYIEKGFNLIVIFVQWCVGFVYVCECECIGKPDREITWGEGEREREIVNIQFWFV